MKKTVKCLMIAVIAALIGFAMAGCSDSGDDLREAALLVEGGSGGGNDGGGNDGGGNDGHPHVYVYTVIGTSSPAQSIQTCSCGKTTGTARNTIIGDTGPAGGIIFYHNPAGFNVQGYGNPGETGYFAPYTAYYLEADSEYKMTFFQWGANGYLINDVTTWDSMTKKNDELAASIGVGQRDTQIIVNYLGTNETNRAAQVCANKTVTVGGIEFKDWFLPSLGELNEMYKARVAGVAGIPTTAWFWSSSLGNLKEAWAQNFGTGVQNFSTKNYGEYVCAVRAF